MTWLMSVGALTLVVLLYWSLADFVLDRPLGPAAGLTAGYSATIS